MTARNSSLFVLLLAEAQRKLLATPNDADLLAEFDCYTRELAHLERQQGRSKAGMSSPQGPADHVWVDLLLRMPLGDNETFDPFANMTTRALETVTTRDLRGNKLRLCLEATQCVEDLKSLVAEESGASTTAHFIIVVNGEKVESSMTIADLIAQSNGQAIHCWQQADPVAAPTEYLESLTEERGGHMDNMSAEERGAYAYELAKERGAEALMSS
jgi:hypothetical protein